MSHLKDDDKRFAEAVGDQDLNDRQLREVAAELKIKEVRANGVIRRWKRGKELASTKAKRQREYSEKRSQREQRRAAKAEAKRQKKDKSSTRETAEDGDVQGQGKTRVGSQS